MNIKLFRNIEMDKLISKFIHHRRHKSICTIKLNKVINEKETMNISIILVVTTVR